MRERISEQKAASAAAEDARDLRRTADARRAAAVAAADAAAVAFSREQLDERALVERRAGALAALCARARGARRARRARGGGADAGPAVAYPAPRAFRRHRFVGSDTATSRHRRVGALRAARVQVEAGQVRGQRRAASPVEAELPLRGVPRRPRRRRFKDASDASKEAKDAADASDASVRLLGDAVKARRRHAADTEDAFETENENDEDESRDARAAEDGESGGSNPAASDPPAQTDLSPEDKKKVLLSVPATLVNAKRAVVGRADISRGWVHFVADEPPLSRGDAAAAADANAGRFPEQKAVLAVADVARGRGAPRAVPAATRRGGALPVGRPERVPGVPR